MVKNRIAMKTNYISYLLALLVVSILSACTPESYSTSVPDVKSGELLEGISFEITHDTSNPNIVYLTSLMDDKYQPSWIHPQGNSQAKQVTLKIPFAGTYSVTFGVQTRGGLVYGEPVQFTVDDMCSDFIKDPMWTKVSGGAGQSKTWYLDLDAEGVSRYALGPIYFFTAGYNWDNLHSSSGANYIDSSDWDAAKAIVPNLTDGSATWYWTADWAGNSWMCDAADFGSMTFDLIGGAHVAVNQEAYGIDNSTGTYMLNTENHTLQFTNALPVHDTNRHDDMKANLVGGVFNILYISDDFMQLLVPATGTCYNYISEEYRNNWQPEPEKLTLPYSGNANDDLTTTTTETKSWSLHMDAPYNWTDLSGNDVYSWDTSGSVPTLSGDNHPYDIATFQQISMTMTKDGDSSGTYVVVNGDGETIEGSYTIDDENWIDFGQPITWANNLDNQLTIATQENKMRVIKVEKEAGAVKIMTLGCIDPSNEEQYQTISFALIVDDSSDQPSGTSLDIDNAKVLVGDLEEKGNIRIEIYNEYGGTKEDPCIDNSKLTFDSMEVTFTISGLNFVEGAAGSYPCGLSFASSDWSVQYWASADEPTANDTTITGDGTYTVKMDATSTVTGGAVVFCIDIMKNIATEVVDITGVTATVDSITLY